MVGITLSEPLTPYTHCPHPYHTYDQPDGGGNEGSDHRGAVESGRVVGYASGVDCARGLNIPSTGSLHYPTRIPPDPPNEMCDGLSMPLLRRLMCKMAAPIIPQGNVPTFSTVQHLMLHCLFVFEANEAVISAIGRMSRIERTAAGDIYIKVSTVSTDHYNPLADGVTRDIFDYRANHAVAIVPSNGVGIDYNATDRAAARVIRAARNLLSHLTETASVPFKLIATHLSSAVFHILLASIWADTSRADFEPYSLAVLEILCKFCGETLLRGIGADDLHQLATTPTAVHHVFLCGKYIAFSSAAWFEPYTVSINFSTMSDSFKSLLRHYLATCYFHRIEPSNPIRTPNGTLELLAPSPARRATELLQAWFAMQCPKVVFDGRDQY